MSFLDHIRACNNAGDLSDFLPFQVSARRLGWVRPGFAELLAGFDGVFEVTGTGVGLALGLVDAGARTAAVERVLRPLGETGTIRAWRNKRYPVIERWGETPLFALERAAVPYLGVRAFGVHLNGYVRRRDGLHLWIGRRGLDRPTAPGKPDNLVAGDQPIGIGLKENLIKECGEEAGMDPRLSRRARPAGAISYVIGVAEGLKRDVLFVYDLEVPEDFEPRNTDGEIVSSELWPVAEVAARIRATDDFKFNVNLVNIDFLVRHGVIGPETEPDYLALIAGLGVLD